MARRWSAVTLGRPPVAGVVACGDGGVPLVASEGVW